MFDFRRRFSLAALVIGCVLLTSCGVAANSTAASVEGHDISIERVLKYIRNEQAASNLGLPLAGVTDDSAPGEVVQSVVGLEIQRNALISALDRWGLSISDDDRVTARQQYEQSGQDFGDDELNDGFVEYYAAFNLLAEKFMSLDPTNESDMRTLYDGMLPEWDQICVTVLGSEEFEIDAITAAADSGESLVEIADAHEGSQSVVLILDSADECLPSYAFPPDLREAFTTTAPGEIGHVISSEMMGTIVYFYEVDEFKSVSFDEALPQLTGLVEEWSTGPEAAMNGVNRWAGYLAVNAEVNPQFGSGVSYGQTITVMPPPRPPVQQRPTTPEVEPQELLIEE